MRDDTERLQSLWGTCAFLSAELEQREADARMHGDQRAAAIYADLRAELDRAIAATRPAPRPPRPHRDSDDVPTRKVTQPFARVGGRRE